MGNSVGKSLFNFTALVESSELVSPILEFCRLRIQEINGNDMEVRRMDFELTRDEQVLKQKQFEENKKMNDAMIEVIKKNQNGEKLKDIGSKLYDKPTKIEGKTSTELLREQGVPLGEETVKSKSKSKSNS